MFQKYSGKSCELLELPLAGHYLARLWPRGAIHNSAFPRSHRKRSLGCSLVSAVFAASLFMTAARSHAQQENVQRENAQQEKVIYSFGADGQFPYANLIFDAAGNLYGTTFLGPGQDYGSVFELKPNASGSWAETTLYSFPNGTGIDGASPLAGLIFDGSVNLYSTTINGGLQYAKGIQEGVVFELSLENGTSTGWTEAVLHRFTEGGSEGCMPNGSLIFDASGNLYGTAPECGLFNDGAVFELTPTIYGWKATSLYSFNGKDGASPEANLIFDAAGNLYGTTVNGGAYNEGTVFELTPASDGRWTEKVLHDFNQDAKDGSGPWSGLAFDKAGNLWGTTVLGGACSVFFCGTVFKLTPPATGKHWGEELYSFNGTDGYGPQAGLVADAAGNLYGTTSIGGIYGCGTVFEVSQPPNEHWTVKVIHEFLSSGGDGCRPLGSLVLDSAGNLYGTTNGGGANGFGTVFEITQ